MSISIPKDSKSLNMNDLIASSQQYAAQDSQVCDKCNTPLQLRTQIVDARQILVLKLDVWGKVEGGAKMVRRNASINSVSNSSIKVGDKVFTLQSSVHILSDKSAGFSYISIVRSNGKWIHCNNDVLSGLKEPKICIWLSMSIPLRIAPSNVNLNPNYIIINLNHSMQQPLQKVLYLQL